MEDDYISPEQAAAFNAGYMLQQHDPKLLDKILQSAENKNDYLNALAAGKKQQEREKIIEQQQHIKEKNQQKKLSR